MTKTSWQEDVRRIGREARAELKGLIEATTSSDLAHKLNVAHDTAEALRGLVWAALEAGVEEVGDEAR